MRKNLTRPNKLSLLKFIFFMSIVGIVAFVNADQATASQSSSDSSRGVFAASDSADNPSFSFNESLNAIAQQGSSEPVVSCPSGYDKLGGPYDDKVKLDLVRQYSIQVPLEGELLITGWAREGHPELGCSPAGDTPFEPHDYCSQQQHEEQFEVFLSGNGQRESLGYYTDKQDPTKENYWFPAGNFSKTVPPGSYQILLEHPLQNHQSINYLLVACHKASLIDSTPTPVSPTPTEPSYYPTVTPTPTLPPVTPTEPPPNPTATPTTPSTATPTSTPTTLPSPSPTPTAEPTFTPTTEPTPIPTLPPTPTLGPPSCNDYTITGSANDIDSPGSPLTIEIKIDGISVGSTTATNGRFSFPIPDDLKDDYIHDVMATTNNPYTSQVWVDTGLDDNGNPTGYYSTVNNQAYAYVDYSAFRCMPPETDLQTTGEAWAKTPGRTGQYPDDGSGADLATEKIWLEDTAEFKIQIENKHATFAAINPEIIVDLPLDPDSVLNWELTYNPDWACTRSGLQVTCTRDRFESAFTRDKYGTGFSQYTLITGHSLVPGTFLPNELIWNSEINSDTPEISPADNVANFDLEVVKSWQQTVDYTQLLSSFNQAIYHETITSGLIAGDPEVAFESNELIPSLFQMPIYEVPALTLSAYPTLTVKFCIVYSESNCQNDSAIIEGAVRLLSYEYTETIPHELTGSNLTAVSGATDLQSQTVQLSYGISGGGRFVDEDPAHCQAWMTKMATRGDDSQCAGRYEIFKTFSSADKANYAWAESEMFGLLLYKRGGRPVDCDLTGNNCIVDDNGRPGIYLTSGTIDYEVVFYDDQYQRLGPDPIPFPYTAPFTIINQQLTQFQEREVGP